MRNFTKLITASVLALTLSTTASADHHGKKKHMKKEMAMETATPTTNIVEAAIATDSLSTLVAAVKQAQLVDTLSGPGPFTVFAPTNAAFDALPDGTVSTLLMDENRADLRKVLTAHVVQGTITSSDLMAKFGDSTSFTVETVSGDTLTFYKMDGGIRVADENDTLASIAAADLMQTNGVVHVVDSVLVPQ